MNLLEKFAEQAHISWADWTRWMLDKWGQDAGGQTYQQRWRQQIGTPYRDLSEQEKESDREEARRYLALMTCGTCQFCGAAEAFHGLDLFCELTAGDWYSPRHPESRAFAASRLGRVHLVVHPNFGCVQWEARE